MDKYKPLHNYSYFLFALDESIIVAILFLFKYFKISNYIVFKIIICCICTIFAIKSCKIFLKTYILKNGLLLSFFSGMALGVLTLPYNNPMSIGCCAIVCGFYIIIRMKKFDVDYYADKYDSRDSKLYILANLERNANLYFGGPILILMGILTFIFGIKEIIEIIF